MPPETKTDLDEIKDHFKALDLEMGAEDHDLQTSQCHVFAHQVCIARWLIQKGVKPDVCIGHSLGEVAAFHIAGRISLRDAGRIIKYRAEHLEKAKPGRMIAVKDCEENVQRVIRDHAATG